MTEKSGNKFYITTPIYYVNARPHIGHTYTTIVCDAMARRHRLLGDDTYFLTGTDEHGQKIERSATAAGKSPNNLRTRFPPSSSRCGIGWGSRTTNSFAPRAPSTTWGAEAMFEVCRSEATSIRAPTAASTACSTNCTSSGGPGAPCPECGRLTETVQEENYFFKLSAMEEPLLKYYAENPDFIRPETRRNEVISFVKGGLRDQSISPNHVQVGYPGSGRSGARHLRLARRALQLHHGARLRV